MPVIHVSILEGRSIEVKRAYVKALTDCSVEHLKCRPENVTIILSDMPFEHYARAGKLKSDEMAEAGLDTAQYHAREAKQGK